MEEIIEIIKAYGIETVLIALVINILTGIVKIPIKKMCSGLKNSKNITRFIVFLPIIIGLGVTYIYKYYFDISLMDKEFLTTWLTATSLSLTFYAVFEKIIPNTSKNNEFEEEIKTTQLVIEELIDITNNVDSNTNKKIILRGKKEGE